MAIKISQLPSAVTLTGTELLPIVQGGVTSQININTLIPGLKLSPSAPVGSLQLNANGNLGLGVTPNATWYSTIKAFQTGTTGSIWSRSSDGLVSIANNFYFDGTDTRYLTSNYASDMYQLNGTFVWRTAASGTAGNPITFTTAMMLNASGQLSIVAGTGTELGTARLGLSKYDNNNSSSNIFQTFYINNGVTGSGAIAANGASAAAFTSFSDLTLKTNIQNLPSQLANILALRPVSFDFKDGSGSNIGFIAQEVQAIYPDLVAPNIDGLLLLADMNKNDARVIKAIQELSAQVTTLQARLTAANIA